MRSRELVSVAGCLHVGGDHRLHVVPVVVPSHEEVARELVHETHPLARDDVAARYNLTVENVDVIKHRIGKLLGNMARIAISGLFAAPHSVELKRSKMPKAV